MRRAVAVPADSQRDNEPPLVPDTELVHESNGMLIVPYNFVQHLALREPREQLLDCRPHLVDLDHGNVRFGRLEEWHRWRSPAPVRTDDRCG